MGTSESTLLGGSEGVLSESGGCCDYRDYPTVTTKKPQGNSPYPRPPALCGKPGTVKGHSDEELEILVRERIRQSSSKGTAQTRLAFTDPLLDVSPTMSMHMQSPQTPLFEAFTPSIPIFGSVPQAKNWKVTVGISSAANLPKLDLLGNLSDIACCASVFKVDLPTEVMGGKVVHKIDTTNGQSNQNDVYYIQPQFRSKKKENLLPRDMINPCWEETFTTSECHRELEFVGSLWRNRRPADRDGKGPCMLFVSIHDTQAKQGENSVIGEVLVPLQPGAGVVDSWYPLAQQDGDLVKGHGGACLPLALVLDLLVLSVTSRIRSHKKQRPLIQEYTNEPDPAHAAAEKGDLNSVESFLSGEGADYLKRVFDRELHINSCVTEEGNRGGWTLLFCAAMSGEPDIVKFFIENGADVTIVDVYNQTCLAYAKGSTVRTIIKSEQTKREKQAEHEQHLCAAWTCIAKHEDWVQSLARLRHRQAHDKFVQEQKHDPAATELKQNSHADTSEESSTERAHSPPLRVADEEEEPAEDSTQTASEKLQRSIEYATLKCAEELDAVTEHVVRATEAAEYFERLQVAYSGRPLDGTARERAAAVFSCACGSEDAVAGPEQLGAIAEMVRQPKTSHDAGAFWSDERSAKLAIKFGGIEDDPVMYLPEFLDAFAAFSMLVNASVVNNVADSMLEAQAGRELAAGERHLGCQCFDEVYEALERADHFFGNLSTATMVRGKDGAACAVQRPEVAHVLNLAAETEARSRSRQALERQLSEATLALDDYKMMAASFFKRAEASARLERAKTCLQEAKTSLEQSGAGPQTDTAVIRFLFARACPDTDKAHLPRNAVPELLASLAVTPRDKDMREIIGAAPGTSVSFESFLETYQQLHAAQWRRGAEEAVEAVRLRTAQYAKQALNYAKGAAAYQAGEEEFEEHNFLDAEQLALDADELFALSKTREHAMLCQEFATRSAEAHVRALRASAYQSTLEAAAQRQEHDFKGARRSLAEARAALDKTGRGDDTRGLAAAEEEVDAAEQRAHEEEFIPRVSARMGEGDSLLLQRHYHAALEVFRECGDRGDDFLDDFPRSRRAALLLAAVHARSAVALAAIGTTSGTESCRKWFDQAAACADESLALRQAWPTAMVLRGLGLAGAGREAEATKCMQSGLASTRVGSGDHRRMAVLYVLATGDGQPGVPPLAEARRAQP